MNIFGVFEGNLLPHIIPESGIKVEPERIKAISQIPFPVNKKAMQSFLWKINFLCQFISNYDQTAKPLQEMINKDATCKWDKSKEDSFS